MSHAKGFASGPPTCGTDPSQWPAGDKAPSEGLDCRVYGLNVPSMDENWSSRSPEMRWHLCCLLLLFPAVLSSFAAPQGCSTDSWVLGDVTLCKEKSYWMQWANRECGQAVHNITFSAPCTPNTHKRIDFVCCAPKETNDLHLEEFKAHFRHHVFANLKQLYANHQRVKELERNETKVLQELTEDVMPLERSLEVAGMHFIQSQSIMSRGGHGSSERPDDGPDIGSDGGYRIG
uniref:Extracellular protein n=1 Tax=Steinernema glaseri TaxID=37863 RepID=A0A1I7ZW35_9BILA